jgi:hypothetical protein
LEYNVSSCNKFVLADVDNLQLNIPEPEAFNEAEFGALFTAVEEWDNDMEVIEIFGKLCSRLLLCRQSWTSKLRARKDIVDAVFLVNNDGYSHMHSIRASCNELIKCTATLG